MSSDQASNQQPAKTGVTGRYAAAFFDLATEEGAADKVEAELNDLRKSIAETDDFRSFIESPVYGRDDQLAGITAIAEKADYSALTQNFLKLVATNGRLRALPGIIASFNAMAAQARGEISAEAVSAAPMSDEQVKALRMEIESMVGKAVNLETRVDADLLGGLIVKIGSKMIDSSLRTKLNKLKNVMKEA